MNSLDETFILKVGTSRDTESPANPGDRAIAITVKDNNYFNIINGDNND